MRLLGQPMLFVALDFRVTRRDIDVVRIASWCQHALAGDLLTQCFRKGRLLINTSRTDYFTSDKTDAPLLGID